MSPKTRKLSKVQVQKCAVKTESVMCVKLKCKAKKQEDKIEYQISRSERNERDPNY